MNINVNNNTVERKKAASELFAPWFSLRDSKVENSDIWSDDTWTARMVHPKDDGGWGFQDMNASSTYAPAVEKLNDAITLMQGRLGTTNTLANAATRKLRIRNWAGRATRLKEIGVESVTSSSLVATTDNNVSSPTNSVILRISANKYYEFGVTSGNLQMRTCTGNPVDKTATIGSWTNIAVTNIYDVHGAAFIDTNKILVFMTTSTSTYRVAGVVITVSGDAYASNGTVNELSAAFTAIRADGKDACCKLDTDKAAIVFKNTASSYRPIVMVATVSGTTITWAHAAAYSYGSGSFSSTEQFCIKQLDTNSAIVTAVASNDLWTFCFTFSGTTPSTSSSRNDGQSSGTHIFLPFVISSTQFGVWCGYGGGATGNSKIIMFGVTGGNTITPPVVTVSLTTSDQYTFTHNSGSTFYYMTDTYITELTYNGTDVTVVRSYPHGLTIAHSRNSQLMTINGTDKYIQVLASFIHYKSITVTVNSETPVVCSGYDIDTTSTTGYFAINLDSNAEGEFYISITQSSGSSMTLVLGDLNVLVK